MRPVSASEDAFNDQQTPLLVAALLPRHSALRDAGEVRCGHNDEQRSYGVVFMGTPDSALSLKHSTYTPVRTVVEAEDRGAVSAEPHRHMLPVAVMRPHLQPHASHDIRRFLQQHAAAGGALGPSSPSSGSDALHIIPVVAVVLKATFTHVMATETGKAMACLHAQHAR